MTKNKKFWWSNIKFFFTWSTILIWVETRHFGIPKHIHWLKRMGFLGQLSGCKMPNFDAVYIKRIGKGSFFSCFRPMFPLSCYSKVWHVRRSGNEHFESKHAQILVMKCVSEMQFMKYFCYLTVKSAHICCKILLGDVRRIVVAFTDDTIQETGFLAIILNAV